MPPSRSSLSLVTFLSTFVVSLAWGACGGESIDLADRPCPCVEGFTCCPASNTCESSESACISGGDGGSDTSADGDDASFSSAITPGVIQCGARPACESPSPVCCGDNQLDAGTCGGSNAVCSSQIVLRCDGPEDCTAGAVCCMSSSGFYSTCSNVTDQFGGMCFTDDASPAVVALCHDHTQCSTDVPNCCPVYTGASWPVLGICSAMSTTTSGACDTP